LVPLLFAHGTSIELTVAEQTIHMHALFDTGEPMGAAQIVVYAADNPRQAWLTGVADSAGNYSFPVDTGIAGQWAISVRTAGHGEILHFTVTPSGVIDVAQSDGRSPLQTTLLAGGVVVVLGGVAWYFSRPKNTPY
jgi:nickel transport protein